MPLAMIGISHRTAPVELREKLAFSEEELPGALSDLTGDEDISEAVILSTCNRTEIYISTSSIERGSSGVMAFLRRSRHLDETLSGDLETSRYLRHGAAAVEHLFRVVCSLDSLVLGEAQIIGQVRHAFMIASKAGCCGELFDELFRRALSAGKRSHSETAIGANSVSVATAAVDMVRGTLGTLEGCSVAVLGSGDMGTLASRYLAEEGVEDIVVLNRTFSHAKALADELDAQARPLDDLEDVLADVDVLIASVAADKPVVTTDMVEKACLARRGGGSDPLILFDIALPRSIEVECDGLDGVVRYDLDDLDALIESHQQQRFEEVAHVEEIVADEVDSFLVWLQEREVTPTIKQMYAKATKIKTKEVSHALDAIANKNGAPVDDDERAIVEAMANALINKMLHGPTARLRKQARNPDAYLYTDTARYLFGLDVNPPDSEHGYGPGRRCRLDRGEYCQVGSQGHCLQRNARNGDGGEK